MSGNFLKYFDFSFQSQSLFYLQFPFQFTSSSPFKIWRSVLVDWRKKALRPLIVHLDPYGKTLPKSLHRRSDKDIYSVTDVVIFMTILFLPLICSPQDDKFILIILCQDIISYQILSICYDSCLLGRRLTSFGKSRQQSLLPKGVIRENIFLLPLSST